MKFWWVNHSQTQRQEIQGEYLWSPIVEASGSRSQFYDNMRIASPGDYVLSFANSALSYVGCVTDFAINAPKPVEFETIGAYWAHQGWFLPVTWLNLPFVVRPIDDLENIAPLLPPKYSPIRAESGKGNQKAYLCEIGRDLFQRIVQRSRFVDFESLRARQEAVAPGQVSSEMESFLAKKLFEDDLLSLTEKIQEQKSRIGQGKFRANVLAIEKQCRITGIDRPEWLIASHIKPWRLCENSYERLDGANGLLLAPHVDFLFDKGLISFSNVGGVLISKRISRAELDRFGLSALSSFQGQFNARQEAYLKFHRDYVFHP